MKSSLLALTIVSLSLSACSSWFYGESNYPEPNELREVQSQFNTQILWQKNLGDESGERGLRLSPASDGQHVYAVSADGYFYRFDKDSGKEIYRVDLRNDISSGLTVAGNFAFLGTKNGDVMAIRLEDGQIMWRSRLSSVLLSRPAFGDGLLAVYASDGQLSVFNPADGALVWRHHSKVPMLSMRGNASPIIGGGVVMLSDENGALQVLDARTGISIANDNLVQAGAASTVAAIIDQDASPKINNNRLFASAYGKETYAVDLQSGAPLWRNERAASGVDFAISPTELYLSTAEDHVVALDQDTGNELWRNSDLVGRRLSPPLAIPGLVGVLDLEGYLTWLDSRNGNMIARSKIAASGSKSEALILPDVIVWQLDNGSIVALRPQ